MTQQFNLPPGMVEAAAEAMENWHKAGMLYHDCARSAIKAALEWAVKEGWAKTAFGNDWIAGWCATEFIPDDDDVRNPFPALILRLEEPKP